MTIRTHKLGPGSLKFGETGSEVEFAVGLRSCAVEPEVDQGDSLSVLSGDELVADDEESYNLTGSLLQTYDKDSLIVWAHVTAGQVVPFTFRPDNDKGLAVTGSVKVRRLRIGGDVKERNTSDFEFPGEGMYSLVDADTQTAIDAWPSVDTAPDTTDPVW